MNNVIVQINFDFDIPKDKLTEHATKVAGMFAKIDGLLWKIWLVNESEHLTGGIYLFENKKKAQAYVDGEVVAKLKRDWTNVNVKIFDTIKEASAITRAPLPD